MLSDKSQRQKSDYINLCTVKNSKRLIKMGKLINIVKSQDSDHQLWEGA